MSTTSQTNQAADGPQDALTAPEPVTPPSLIETIRVETGHTLPLLDLHLERLQRSSSALCYPCPEEASIRAQVIRAVANLEPSAWWRLRLLLASDGNLSLETTPLAPPQPPLKVVLQGQRMSGAAPWLLHKTTHRPWYEAAAHWLATHPDIFDVLYWNEEEDMCEGSRSNLYVQTTDGRWLTPPLQSGALPGVQRAALLRGGLVEEARISRQDFLQAKAIRISNGLRGWCDVVRVDG